MQREKEHVFVVRLRGGIDLPSFWLTFFFRLSSSVSFLPHTYSFPRPCSFLFIFFFAVPSFSPTLSQINLCPLSSLNPPPQHIRAHTQMQLYCSLQLPSDEIYLHFYLFFIFLKFPQLYFFHMGTKAALAL